MNVKLVIEYEGTEFAGWQLQVGQRTVEGELRAALAMLPVELRTLVAAGRTDAGAHAEGQVVNIRCSSRLAPQRLRGALNAHLPPDVVVLDAAAVPEAFHARYDARWRQYRYCYLDRSVRPALDRRRCWHVAEGPLDLEAMAAAVPALVGRHDWTTFCSAGDPARSKTRSIERAEVRRVAPLVMLDLVGEGFLRGMVRGVAGALAEIGLGRREPAWLGEILAARNRRLAPQPAPPQGLTLVEVGY